MQTTCLHLTYKMSKIFCTELTVSVILQIFINLILNFLLIFCYIVHWMRRWAPVNIRYISFLCFYLWFFLIFLSCSGFIFFNVLFETFKLKALNTYKKSQKFKFIWRNKIWLKPTKSSSGQQKRKKKGKEISKYSHVTFIMLTSHLFYYLQ